MQATIPHPQFHNSTCAELARCGRVPEAVSLDGGPLTSKRVQLIPPAEFLAWAAERGIGRDPRYPRADTLTFLGVAEVWRSWDMPRSAGKLSSFVEVILSAANAPGGAFVVFPRGQGSWLFGGERTPMCNRAMEVVARGTGISANFRGAVRFEPSELPQVLALAVASLVFGSGTGEDLYILPENASCILMTDHHDAVIGSFRSAGEMDVFASRLVELAVEDPESLPEPAVE